MLVVQRFRWGKIHYLDQSHLQDIQWPKIVVDDSKTGTHKWVCLFWCNVLSMAVFKCWQYSVTGKTEPTENLHQSLCPFKCRMCRQKQKIGIGHCRKNGKMALALQKYMLEQNFQLLFPQVSTERENLNKPPVFWVSTETENLHQPLWKNQKMALAVFGFSHYERMALALQKCIIKQNQPSKNVSQSKTYN